jgi:hypothetical protein
MHKYWKKVYCSKNSTLPWRVIRWLKGKISLMKQKFVVTQQYTFLQEREKTWTILFRPRVKHVMFLRKYWDKQFVCGHNILIKSIFVTVLSSNAGISFRRIVWVMTNCLFQVWFDNCKIYALLYLNRFFNFEIYNSIRAEIWVLFGAYGY